jgi:hypothetical protein
VGAVARALRGNGGLEALDLEGNRIGEEGARVLLEVLTEEGDGDGGDGGGIRRLGDVTLMPGNNITDGLQRQIKEVLISRVVVS